MSYQLTTELVEECVCICPKNEKDQVLSYQIKTEDASDKSGSVILTTGTAKESGSIILSTGSADTKGSIILNDIVWPKNEPKIGDKLEVVDLGPPIVLEWRS